MNIYIQEKLKTSGLVDHRTIDPELKANADYYLSCAKGYYGEYLRHGCYMSPYTHKSFDELELYGAGNINVEEMKGFLNSGEKSLSASPYESNDEKKWERAIREGWNNLDWSPVSPMPRINKIIDKAADIFSSDIRVSPLDPFSRNKEEEEKANAYVRMKDFEFQLEYSKRAGIPIDETQYIPENIDQLNLYAQNGGFKQAHARALEALIKGISKFSDYEEIQKDHIRDLKNFGICGMKAEFDPLNGRIYYRHISPKLGVIQSSRYNDFRDSSFAGDFEAINLSDLAVYGFNEEQRGQIAHSYCGIYDNVGIELWDDVNVRNSYGNYIWDSFKVCVCHWEWKDTDKEYRKEYTTPFGEKRIAAEKWGKPIGVKQNKKVSTISKTVLREASWIVGTDFVYNFGIVSNIPREDNKDVSLSYKFYRLSEESVVSQIMPMIKGYYMAWMRLQNDIATAMPDFWAVNIHMIQNVKMGGGMITPPEIIKMAKKSKLLPYNYSMTGKYEGGAGQPMTKVQGDTIERIDGRLKEMNTFLYKIFELTGISPGELTNSIETATEAKQAYASTNDALVSIAKAFNKVYLNTSKTVEMRLQSAMLIPSYLKDAYSDILSDYDIEMLNIAKKNSARYSMDITIRPSEREIAKMEEAANIALQAQLIEYPVWLYVKEMLDNKTNLSWIRIYVSYMITKKKEADSQAQQAAIKSQSEGNQQLEAVKQQGEMQRFQMEAQKDAAMNQSKAEAENTTIIVQGRVDAYNNAIKLLADVATDENTRALLLKELDLNRDMLYGRG